MSVGTVDFPVEKSSGVDAIPGPSEIQHGFSEMGKGALSRYYKGYIEIAHYLKPWTIIKVQTTGFRA